MGDIISSAPQEIFFILFGSVLLFGLQLARRWTQRQRRYRAITRIAAGPEQDSCMDIHNGVPEFRLTDIQLQLASHLGEARCFVLSPWDLGFAADDRLVQTLELSSRLSFAPKTRLLDGGDFDDWARRTGIDDIEDRVKLAAGEVLEKFRQQRDGALTNNPKYGLYDVRPERIGLDERPGLRIRVYKTDYFTHRVMREVYRRLRGEGAPIASVDRSRLFPSSALTNPEVFGSAPERQPNYRSFMTSLGVNVMVICRTPLMDTVREVGRAKPAGSTREFVMMRRSANVKRSLSADGEAPLHVTVNEGLSTPDLDRESGESPLGRCLARGMQEELGVTEAVLDLALHSAFYDMFLVRPDFEVGVSAVVEFDLTWEELQSSVAKDQTLETVSEYRFQARSSDVAEVLKGECGPVTTAGKYVLRRVAAREGVFSGKQ